MVAIHNQVHENMYLSLEEITRSVQSLKDYIQKSEAIKLNQKKDLLADDNNEKVIIEVIFKNVPSNRKTYIHTINLPHHWRMILQPEDYNIAMFVKHRKPETKAEALQFERDRDLDVAHTHNYYKSLFTEKLEPRIKSKITKLISTKELATEYNNFPMLEKLSKFYDLFLADKQLMENKLNSLPRRLGRRFWVTERKIPLLINMNANNLNERFENALSTEPFYVIGRSSTEKIQVGITSQTNAQIAENIVAFLKKLNLLYGSSVRMLRLRSTYGLSLPIFADLDPLCPRVAMKRKKRKQKTIVSDSDFLPETRKLMISPGGDIRILRTSK